jgi:hypothetical protein
MWQIFSKRGIFFWIALSSVIILAVVYKHYNPTGNIYFPKCPFRELTGLKCPGCGSQRAVHHILNLRISRAAQENFLLVISIPYLLAGLVFESLKKPGSRVLYWRKLLFGRRAIFIILAMIILFWILRNIFNF